jgi:monovalent cation/hydrogen antiporter
MHYAEPVVLLLMLVAGLVIVANKLAVPYPVLLVLGGLALSFVPFLPVVRLNPDLVLFFFLPPLLYPAALFTSWRDFQRNLRPILFLAIGLVLMTTTVVAWSRIRLSMVCPGRRPSPWTRSSRRRMRSRPKRS